jgi:hypothetical protein
VSEIDARAGRLVAYLEALEAAAEAIDRARRLFPDPGLDHAFDRLRRQSAQYAQRLLMPEPEAATRSARSADSAEAE